MIYAKINKDKNNNILSYESIYTHSKKVIKYAFENIYKEDLNKISNITGWGSFKMKEAVFFASFFHDIGKITKEFQDTILYNKKSNHPFYSAILYYSLSKNWDFDFVVNKGRRGSFKIDIVLLSIITHHQLLKEGLYTNDHFKDIDFQLLKQDFEKYLSQISILYEKYLGKKFTYEIKLDEIKTQDFINQWQKYANKNNYLLDTDGYFRLRTLYGYISGILNIGDWLASADFSSTLPNIKFENSPSLNLSFSLKVFQEKLKNINKNVLVEIPTGEGKTEGSLLWAINNWKGNFNKIIYTLPTQTTSNKMYDRLSSYFGKENVGIIHSSADLFIKDILQKEYEKKENFDDFFLSEKNFNKLFSKPITVSTLDAVLKFFINMGRWNISLVNHFNSILIIDEIHTYDLKLSGILSKLIQQGYFEKMGIKLAILSASFPKIKKDIITGNKLNTFEVITEKKLFEVAPNHIQKIDDNLDDNLDLIKDNKLTLIVRNTIKESIETYKKLKEKGYDCMLYNSAFRRVDRKLKEQEIFYRLGKENFLSENEEIILDGEYINFGDYIRNKVKKNKPFVLIATQIVEISLDIDFDILLTDIAPIDSLIQRFGRINRKKRKDKKGKIFVFGEYNKIGGKYPYNEEILDLSFKYLYNGKLKLLEFNNILEKVYSEYFNLKKGKEDLNTTFSDGELNLFNKWKESKGIFKNSVYDVRKIENNKIDAYLLSDYERYFNEGFLNEKNLLPVKIWDFEKNIAIMPDKKAKLYYPVVDLNYDYENSISLKNDIYLI